MKGKHAAGVNSALRSDLAAAIDRADRAERATDDLRHRLAASERRIEELTAEFHPAIVAERARADAAMRRDDAVAAADKVEQWWMTHMRAIRPVMRMMIITAAVSEEDFINNAFIKVMHHAYGDDLAEWLAVSGDQYGMSRRELRRDWLRGFKCLKAMDSTVLNKNLNMKRSIEMLAGMGLEE